MNGVLFEEKQKNLMKINLNEISAFGDIHKEYRRTD